MASIEPFLDLSAIDFSRVVADIDEIRRYNPQRFEMEMLTAVVYLDPAGTYIVGYKDVSTSDFWVRGHMPDHPIMPGVMMCECAAQLCSFAAHRLGLTNGRVVGFGGLENVRFRGPVVPGNRLIMICRQEKVRRGRIIVSDFQGIVGTEIVCSGTIKGVPLPPSVIPPVVSAL